MRYGRTLRNVCRPFRSVAILNGNKSLLYAKSILLVKRYTDCFVSTNCVSMPSKYKFCFFSLQHLSFARLAVSKRKKLILYFIMECTFLVLNVAGTVGYLSI